MGPQGDEDVGDSVSYVPDDESMDIDDVPPQVTFTPPVPPEQRTSSPPTSSLATTRPAPRLNGHSNHHAQLYQPIARHHSTSIRGAETTLRAEHPNPSRETRTITRFPTHSPPQTYNSIPGPSRLNPTERLPTSPAGSEGSSAGAFFRTYQSSSVDGRPDGALTPDLVFAEIGHGHGPGPVTWNGQEPAQNRAYQFVDPATLTVDDRPQYGTGVSQTRGGGNWRPEMQSANIGQGTNGAYHATGGTVNGTYRANASHPISTHGMTAQALNGIPAAMPNPPITREERSRGRPRTSRDPQESLQAATTLSGQGQGRVPKRTLRSTLNTVEQHATSFLFGRPMQDGEGSGAGATTREDSTRGY